MPVGAGFPPSGHRANPTPRIGPLAQHFLLSAAARSLSLAQVARMSDDDAHSKFCEIRWSDNAGQPYCPKCGGTVVYPIPSRKTWQCKACNKQFSVTSGTIFASRKLPIRDYLLAIAIFVNGAKGHAALQFSRDLNVQYKTAFVLSHKLREAIAAQVHAANAPELAGEVEIDGLYTGGHQRPANRKAERVDRRASEQGKRLVVAVVRERLGRTRPWVVAKERDAVPMIRAAVASGTVVHADESAGWDMLLASYPVMRVNHSREFMARMVPAPIRLSPTSRGCAGRSTASIIGSPGHISISTPTKWHGGRTTGGCRTVSNGAG